MSSEAHAEAPHAAETPHAAPHAAEAPHAAPHAAEASHAAPHAAETPHAAPHAAEAPHAAPHAAEAPHAAPHAAEAPRAQAPVVKAIKWVQAKCATVCNGIVSFGIGTNDNVKKVLRVKHTPPKEASLLKTPIIATGQVLDGVALGAPRNAWPVIENVGSIARSVGRLTNNVFRPFRAVFEEPKERIFKPIGRIITSTASAVWNAIKFIPAYLDDTVTRGIHDPVHQINYKTEKIPIAGKIEAKSTNFITKIASVITNSARTLLDWGGSWLDKLHSKTIFNGGPTSAHATAENHGHAEPAPAH